jgi:hypothetical protein
VIADGNFFAAGETEVAYEACEQTEVLEQSEKVRGKVDSEKTDARGGFVAV